MHKDYDKNKQGKLDKQKKAYVDHAMTVLNGVDNYTVVETNDNTAVAERIDEGVKLTVIQDFNTFTHELLTEEIIEEIIEPNKIKTK